MLFLNIMSIPQNYALNFAKEVDESLALSTGKMIPIYNSNDRLVGYSIEYYIDNTPYGYINLNFTYEEPVVDMLSQQDIMLSTYKYACVVVALTEIANQEGILKNSDIADTLWCKIHYLPFYKSVSDAY